MEIEIITGSNVIVILFNLILNLFMFSRKIVSSIPDFIDNYLVWWIIGIDVIVWIIAYNILKKKT